MATVNFNAQLPGYEVLAELGRGNSRVLKARHVASGELVAIKQYAFTVDADTHRRFEQESQIMTRIDHPNVVRVREVQLDANMPYIVMDLVEGGDLRSLLRQEGFLDILTTIRLGLQLTGAFRAMHSAQVIHRDIKPENVLYRRLVSGELHFLLTDFGISKFWADDNIRTLTGQSLMTYEYAAPEQFDNPRQVDKAADYYALGVMLYECLTGKVPFILHNETGLAQFMQQVLMAPLPKFITVSGQPLPPSLATLLMCLLARNPQDRLCNIDQLELLLEQSRVEQLNATWSIPEELMTKATVDPVMPVENADDQIDAPVNRQTKQPVGGIRRWWVEICIVIAAALAFGLYSSKVSRLPGSQVVENDSISRNMPESDKPNMKSVDITPGINEEKEINTEINTKEDTVSQVSTEPVEQPPTDSTARDNVIDDSAVAVPPDSAQ